MRTERWGILVIAVATVLVAAGCAPTGGGASPSPTGVSTTPPTPSAEPEPTPSETAPEAALAFDGDCANVIADASEYLGELWDYSSQTWPSAFASLGGVNCIWYSPTGDSLEIVAVPAGTAPDLEETYTETTCEPSYDVIECRLGAKTGGMWILVSRSEPGDDPDLRQPLAEALAAASAWPSPVAPARDEAWWEPIDCADLGAAIDLDVVFGGAAFEAGYPTGFADHPLTPAIDAAGVNAWCPWYSYESNAGIWMNVMPGAGFQWDRISGTEVVVEGATHAVEVRRDESSTLVATDGTNIVTVNEAPGEATELAARVFAAMN